MSDIIKILLQAGIDTEKSIDSINKQIADMSKKAIGIKIKIDIDQEVFKNIKNINEQLKSISVVAPKGIDLVGGDVDKIKQYMDATDRVKKVVTDTTVEYGKQLQFVERINKETGELELTEKIFTDDKKKQLDLINKIADAREKSIMRRMKEDRSLEEKQARAINKALEKEYNLRLKIAEQVTQFQQRMLGTDIVPGEMETFATKFKGKFDTSVFEQIKKETEVLKDIPLEQQTSRMKELKNEWHLLGLTVKESGSVITRSLENMFKFMRFYIAGGMIVSVVRNIRQSISFITEMDTALTEIGMVTNQTRKEVAGLAREFNNLAKEMKVTTKEVAEGAVTFYRQGLAQEEVMERLRVTTMYSKIANVEFSKSAEILTAVVNSMGVEIERATDIFTYLGDATATSGAEIGIAMSKTSGSAAALNIELEKISSWIAHISSKTRESAESIGTSINTMISRMARITEVGYSEEDDTKLNDVAKALDTINISLTETDNSYRNFGDVLDDVGKKWDGLDDQTRAYIATTLAGVRQQSRFLNLMEGYSKSVELYEGALESAGTTLSKFNLYLESNQAIIDDFTASMEGLWLTFLDSDFLMFWVRGATKLTEAITALIDKIGSLGTSATALSIIFMYTFGAKPILGAISTLIRHLMGIQVATKSVEAAMIGLNIQTAILTVGITALVGLLITWAFKAKEAEEAFAKSLDNVPKINDEVNALDDLIRKWENLLSVEHRTVEQKEELKNIQKELARLYPQLATAIDEEGNKLADSIELTKELAEEKRNLLEQELFLINLEAKEKLPMLEKERTRLEEENRIIKERLISGDVYRNVYDAHTGMIINQINIEEELRKQMQDNLETIKENIEETNRRTYAMELENKMLEENIERQKWIKVEELHNQSVKEESEEQLKAIREELIAMGFTSDDVTEIISGNIETVKQKYNRLTETQINYYKTVETMSAVAQKAALEMLNNDKEVTRQLIENTLARIRALQVEIRLLDKQAEFPDELGILEFRRRIEKGKLTKELRETGEEFVNLRKTLSDIEDAIKNIKGISISGKTLGEGTKKITSPYESQLDIFREYTLAIKDLEDQIKHYQLLADLTPVEEVRIEYLNKINKLTKQQQEKTNELNIELRKQRDTLAEQAEKLVVAGQKVTTYDENTKRLNVNIKLYNRLSDEQKKNFDGMIKSFDDLNSQIVANELKWLELGSSVSQISNSIRDSLRSIAYESISLEKRVWEMDIERRERSARKEIDRLKERLDSEIKSIQSDIDREQAAIDRIQESERLRKEREERDRRLQEILELENKYYYLQNNLLGSITEEQAKQAGLESEREKYLENELKIQELLYKIENLRREKNIQYLRKTEEGEWEFFYVADEKEIENVNKQIEDLQKQHHRDIKNLKENTLDALKKAQKDYDEWERQNDIQKDLERRRRRIQQYQEEIRDLGDRFRERERKILQALSDEKENLNRHYTDIDLLTDRKMKELEATFDNNWIAIYKTLKSHFDNIEGDYNSLVEALSKPLPSAPSSYSSSSGGKRASSGGTSSVKGSAPTIEDWGLIYNEARERGDWRTMETANREANKQRGLGDIVTSEKDIEYIKKKSGYAFGGKITETGTMIAPFHGTQEKPEWIFNDDQLRNILKNVVISTVNLVPKTPTAAFATGGSSQIFNIDKLEFPNVKDSKQIENAIKNLSTYANQWANRK